MTIALLAILLAQSPPKPLEVVQHSNDPNRRLMVEAQLSASECPLSGDVGLTLIVEGPGPLDVQVPRPVLATAPLWRVRDEGQPIRVLLDGGRQRWTRKYRLSPLIVGSPAVSLSPLTIRSGGNRDEAISIAGEWPVRVTSSVTAAKVDELRPATSLESPPAAPEPVQPSGGRILVLPVLLLLALVAIKLARRRPMITPRHDAAWALQQLLNASADRVAEVLRLYVTDSFGLPAMTRTTAELMLLLRPTEGQAITPSAPAPAELAELGEILNRCDAVRFAPHPGHDPQVEALAKNWIERLELARQVTTPA